jgi:hypothetical protein
MAGVAVRDLPGMKLGLMVASEDGAAAAIALDEHEVAHLVEALRGWLSFNQLTAPPAVTTKIIQPSGKPN